MLVPLTPPINTLMPVHKIFSYPQFQNIKDSENEKKLELCDDKACHEAILKFLFTSPRIFMYLIRKILISLTKNNSQIPQVYY